jgi:hypothetical protein
LQNFPLRPNGEVGRVDDAAARFPVRPYLVGIFRDLQAVPDRERSAGLFDHFFGLIERVNRKRDYVGIFLFEFVDVRLEVGYLPNAVRSPDAAIENDDGIFAFDIHWNIKRASTSGGYRVIRKRITGTELFSHGITSCRTL